MIEKIENVRVCPQIQFYFIQKQDILLCTYIQYVSKCYTSNLLSVSRLNYIKTRIKHHHRSDVVYEIRKN